MDRILVRFEGDGAGAGELTWGQRDIWEGMRRLRSSLGVGGVVPLASGTEVRDVADMLRFLVGRHQSLHDHLKPFSRKNVFIGADVVLATFSATGATTGTFASVTTIGTSYAGAQLKVKNQGAVTTGATLSVTGKKIDGTTQVITATIGTGTDNFETALSVTTKLFVEVTNVTITGGTNANVYEIVALTDRDISAA